MEKKFNVMLFLIAVIGIIACLAVIVDVTWFNNLSMPATLGWIGLAILGITIAAYQLEDSLGYLEEDDLLNSKNIQKAKINYWQNQKIGHLKR